MLSTTLCVAAFVFNPAPRTSTVQASVAWTSSVGQRNRCCSNDRWVSPLRQITSCCSNGRCKLRMKSEDITEPRWLEVPRDTVAKPLSLLLAAQLVLFIGVGAVIPTLPIYGKAIGLSGAMSGIVIGAPAFALLLGAQPSGRFADVARKPAMIGGMAIIALSDLGTAMSTTLVPLVLSRLGLGLGRCISESGERGMLADFAKAAPELRGRLLSIQQAVLALGIALGAPLGGYAVDAFGARAAFLCVSAAASLTLLLYTLLPETVVSAPYAPSDERPTADAARRSRWSACAAK